MTNASITIALITDVFFDDPNGHRLARRLTEAQARGAELALLPELPMDPWVPASTDARESDAEAPRGTRHRTQAEAARRAGIALWGGAIVRDELSGERYNTSLLFDRFGDLLATYRKVHLPYEEGFWEAAHYRSGAEPPKVVTALPLPLGVQICSDANRSTGCQLLAASGAAVIFVPRATPAATYPRWRLVLRAEAVTAAAWVVSVNRPPESDGPVGGPSLVIAPDGEVVLETSDPLAVIRVDGAAVEAARRDYPGYLEFHPRLYADGWRALVNDAPGPDE